MSRSMCVLLFAICIGFGIAGSSFLRAEDAKSTPTTKPAEAAKPANTKCPVSGEDIDPAETVVYKGKTIAFCCADCEKKFNADPEKYVANMK